MTVKQISENSGNPASNNSLTGELADGEIRAGLLYPFGKTDGDCFDRGRGRENWEPRQRLKSASRKDPGRYYRISLALHSKYIAMAMGADRLFSPVEELYDEKEPDIQPGMTVKDKVFSCVNSGMGDSLEISGFLGVSMAACSSYLSILFFEGKIRKRAIVRFSKGRGPAANVYEPMGRMAIKRLARRIIENANSM